MDKAIDAFLKRVDSFKLGGPSYRPHKVSCNCPTCLDRRGEPHKPNCNCYRCVEADLLKAATSFIEMQS